MYVGGNRKNQKQNSWLKNHLPGGRAKGIDSESPCIELDRENPNSTPTDQKFKARVTVSMMPEPM